MIRQTAFHSRRRQAAARVQLTDTSATRSLSGGTATCSYSINSTGVVQKTNISGTLATYETWLLSGLNSDYEVMVTAIGSSVTGAATGTWLACSTTRTWSVSDAVFDANDASATLTVQIRDATTLAVLASASVTITAQRTG